MVLEEPAGCTCECWERGSARGEGDLVGDTCARGGRRPIIQPSLRDPFQGGLKGDLKIKRYIMIFEKCVILKSQTELAH